MKGKTLAKILTSKPVKYVVKNAPKFLTGLSIVTSIAATGFAIKGTILAVEIERQRKAKIASGELPEPEHPRLETVKSVWKCYIPAATFLGVSIGSSLYGTNISTARTAMATAACKASELAFDEYKAKIVEELGAEKENKIRQDIETDHAEKRLESSQMMAPYTFEKFLCKDTVSGITFYSNIYEIREAFIDMNCMLISGYSDELSVKSYLDYFGIESYDEDRGWNISMTGKLVLQHHLEYDKYNRPVIVFGPSEKPYENYNIYG